MNKIKEEYDELTEKMKKVIEEIVLLEESEIVKKYFELKKQNECLHNKQLGLYKAIKEAEYASCEHILIYSRLDYDIYEGRTYRSCGCIKCGLDDSVLELERESLPFNRRIMYDYLYNNGIVRTLRGINIKIACDLDLAQAIYKKINEMHPDIDDEIVVKYFIVALNDIREIKVNDDRKISRAKRLSLDPNFTRWS